MTTILTNTSNRTLAKMH